MKTNRYLSVVVCISFITALLLPGIVKKVRAEQDKASVETNRNEMSTKEKLTRDKKEFKKEAKKQIAKLDREIDELELKMKKLGSKADADIRSDMNVLKAKRAEAKKDLERLEVASKEKWDAAKKKVSASIDELKNLYDKTRSKFGSN